MVLLDLPSRPREEPRGGSPHWILLLGTEDGGRGLSRPILCKQHLDTGGVFG